MEPGTEVETITGNGSPPQEKQCSSCRIPKPEGDFFPSGWAAKSAQCKKCIADRQTKPTTGQGRKNKALNDISQLFGKADVTDAAVVKEIVELVIMQRSRFDLAVIEAVLKR